MKRLLIIFLFNFIFLSCKNVDEQIICIENEINTNSIKKISNSLVETLRDTLNDWVNNKKYERVQILKNVSWKIDETVFFNSQQNKAIMLLLEIDTATYTYVPSYGEKEIRKYTSYDDIHLIFANKEKGNWFFYYQAMELITIPRKLDRNQKPIKNSFEELSYFGKKEILKSYYKVGECNKNLNFFNNWDVKMLKIKHTKINGYY